jgi:hypothetical protein
VAVRIYKLWVLDKQDLPPFGAFVGVLHPKERPKCCFLCRVGQDGQLAIASMDDRLNPLKDSISIARDCDQVKRQRLWHSQYRVYFRHQFTMFCQKGQE